MTNVIRCVSANLMNGGADPQAFAQLVMALEADVVAVQEIGPEQAEALRRVLSYGRLEAARDHSGMGIALRRPGSINRLPLHHRDAWIAALQPVHWPAAQVSIEVVNVHMAAPHRPSFWSSGARRRRQLRGLQTYLDASPHSPRLLVGDLNSTPLWPVYRRLTSRLADAASLVARRHGTRCAATWGPRPAGRRLARIDHALISGVDVEDFRVVRIEGSDHSAIVVDIRADEGR
jgi:endonuclease/exonuclease/phosphatase family metal-dependent hydrolase